MYNFDAILDQMYLNTIARKPYATVSSVFVKQVYIMFLYWSFANTNFSCSLFVSDTCLRLKGSYLCNSRENLTYET